MYWKRRRECETERPVEQISIANKNVPDIKYLQDICTRHQILHSSIIIVKEEPSTSIPIFLPASHILSDSVDVGCIHSYSSAKDRQQ